MTSERMIETLVVRQKIISKCCYDHITDCECNRTKNIEQFSQINNLKRCSINQNSQFVTTRISESSSVNSR